MTTNFDGAKLALVHRDDVVTILLDDKNDIAYPGQWDFAGGGREGDERPEDTALRETREELGIELTEDRLLWSCREDREDGSEVWLFAAELLETEVGAIRLGHEGQCWRLMPLSDFLSNPNAIPSLKRRLQLYLDWRDQKR